MITMNRHLLSGTPGEVRRTMEDPARDQDDDEYLDGTRFRELAVKLAARHGLTVSAVTSDDGEVYELEVTLDSAPQHEAIVIDRSQPGDHCQMTLERWLPHQRRTTRGGCREHYSKLPRWSAARAEYNILRNFMTRRMR
jgi:hypothetical protein